MNIYAIERTHEIERELRSRHNLPGEPLPAPRKPVFGPLAARAGRALRRAGEGLESWANAPAADERCLPEHTR
jgi:hypothetical protein